jgi:hypothetical protein
MTPSFLLQLLVSLIGGGLSRAAVSMLYNRSVRQRTLRIDFYPERNDMYSAYWFASWTRLKDADAI